MMKFFFMIIFFIVFLNFEFKKFMNQNLIFLMSFMFLFMNFGIKMKFYMISYLFGLDKYSYGLILLVFWIFGLLFLSLSFNMIEMKFCMFLLNFLMLILMICFSSLNYFLFYLYFEVSLIPTFIMIVYWGLMSERLSACYYMFFYTMMFSLFLLILMFKINKMYGTFCLFLLFFNSIKMKGLYYLIFMMSFLVKIPMFMLHSWLLKAHVEAPLFGSMVLASLLLKLGGYGILRFLMINYLIEFNNLIISISLYGCLILSITCINQVDLKVLVAYSSIVHMGLMLGGMMTLFKLGILGGYLMMISHGLCSSGMFYMVNVNYERLNSRLILINKGILLLMPSMGMWWFLMCSSNMAAPFSLNLISEIMLISSLLIYEMSLIFILFFICLLSFFYSLNLFSFIFHGMSMKTLMFNSGKINEFLSLLLHWLPLNLFIFNLSFLM
uniref:NADH-ubiquinone oxidoreductase chain 4 n=1 Tax=Philanthus triangulum TaxID=280486 RepID=H9A9J1_9HYME|nr:NADH dehydrogenase subunit 4 [Philanthus triangulum]AET62616.1 NADH dehydrogenase subunit 4 [Philanthus triangulum]QNV11910.1 NADH dehydrogenase subunit 4 [Philanthus triangulum]